MAYMSQKNKKALAPAIKAVLKKHGVKGTISVNNSSTLVVKIKSGPFDVIGAQNALSEYNHRVGRDNYIYGPSVATYASFSHRLEKSAVGPTFQSDETIAFVNELLDAMNEGNWNNSDIQTDYFDIGWYVSVEFGNWQSGYEYTGDPVDYAAVEEAYFDAQRRATEEWVAQREAEKAAQENESEESVSETLPALPESDVTLSAPAMLALSVLVSEGYTPENVGAALAAYLEGTK